MPGHCALTYFQTLCRHRGIASHRFEIREQTSKSPCDLVAQSFRNRQSRSFRDLQSRMYPQGSLVLEWRSHSVTLSLSSPVRVSATSARSLPWNVTAVMITSTLVTRYAARKISWIRDISICVTKLLLFSNLIFFSHFLNNVIIEFYKLHL